MSGDAVIKQDLQYLEARVEGKLGSVEVRLRDEIAASRSALHEAIRDSETRILKAIYEISNPATSA